MAASAFAVRLLHGHTAATATGTESVLPLLLQNENGPCFIIALVNALILRSEETSGSDSTACSNTKETIDEFKATLVELASSQPARQVSIDAIYVFIIDLLLNVESSDNNIQASSSEEDLEAKSEIPNILPLLNKGLLINPGFDNTTVNDYDTHTASINALLNALKVELFHGFLMPEDLLLLLREKDVIPTYNACQDYLISHMDDSPPDLISEKITFFLNINSTELTKEGYVALLENLEEGKIFLLFRNDHYNTCIKHNGQIYLLVTDIGYISQPDIVWTELSIEDAGNYYNATFNESTINPSPEHVKIKDYEMDKQENSDLILAQQLQSQEDERISKSLQTAEQKKPHITGRKDVNAVKSKPIPKKVTEKPTTVPPAGKIKSSKREKDKSCIIA